MAGSRAAVADGNHVIMAEYAADVRAWVDMARKRTGRACVWVAGHSEGGLVTLIAAQHPDGICGIVLIAAAGRPLGTIMRELDADAPLYWVRDYAQVIRDATVAERVITKSFAAFGLIALALAATGLYGVMAFAVAQRTREIGVRRALGAPARQVLANVFGRSAIELGAGLAIGIVAGVVLSRLLTQSLPNIAGVGLASIFGRSACSQQRSCSRSAYPCAARSASIPSSR
jgi:pimeloyl-ACP methyl ester carboxylesterase